MFTFETEQKVCEVGGVKFGGQPGGYLQNGQRAAAAWRPEGRPRF